VLTLTAAKRSEKASGPSSTNSYVLVTVLPNRYRIPSILCPPETPANKLDKQFTAVCTIAVSLIYLSGGLISENRLDHILFQKMNISNTLAAQTMQRMIKDGYITKITDNSSGQESIEYIVGPRGKIQIGEQGVKGFVSGVWGEDEAENGELDEQLNRALKLAAGPEKKITNVTEQPKKRGRRPAQRTGSDQDDTNGNDDMNDFTDDEADEE
jgi:melanoma-associated antigen